MNIIDTEYKSLAEIDAEIVRFYREDKRTRTIGYDEEKDLPIEEEYIVIVLEKPNEVHYDYVSEKRGDRFGWDFVRGILEQAIVWEDFEINHDAYLYWLEEYRTWEIEQPTETEIDEDGNETTVIVPAPERSVIDLAVRREVYERIQIPFDSNLVTHNGSYDENYDDTEYTLTLTPITKVKTNKEIADYHREQAKILREEIKLSNILAHGHYWQVRQEDRNNMDELIKFAERNNRMDETTDWITADNDSVTLTIHQLLSIKDMYVLRMGELFAQYRDWKKTGMQAPFVYSEER